MKFSSAYGPAHKFYRRTGSSGRPVLWVESKIFTVISFEIGLIPRPLSMDFSLCSRQCPK